jgi:hypothetical protein
VDDGNYSEVRAAIEELGGDIYLGELLAVARVGAA